MFTGTVFTITPNQKQSQCASAAERVSGSNPHNKARHNDEQGMNCLDAQQHTHDIERTTLDTEVCASIYVEFKTTQN